MATYYDNEEIPFPLVRRHARSATAEIESARSDELDVDDFRPASLDSDPSISQPPDAIVIRDDRMSPGVSGGIAGFFAGLAALGAVHALQPEALTRPILAAAQAQGLDFETSLGIAYVTCGAIGSLVGALFGAVTRYLRRWGPLLLWALVFFVSLAMLLLATASAYGRGAGPVLTGPILAGSAAFAVVVSFSLPIRRRR